MMGVRRWAIAGLLCACGMIGCVQLPSRDLFARRIKPTTDESRADELADHSVELGEASSLDSGSKSRADGSSPSDSDEGFFDLPGRKGASSTFSKVEAPPPNRRASAPPRAFVAASNARELLPNADSKSTKTFADRDGVVLADYESTARENSSDIELVAGEQRAKPNESGIVNPWDRFRGLTNRAGANDSTAEPAVDSAVSNDPRDDRPVRQRALPQRAEENAAMDQFAGQRLDNRGIAQPPMRTESFDPSAAGNSINNASSRSEGLDTWPRTPSASGFNSSSNNSVNNQFSPNTGTVTQGTWNTGGGFPAVSNSSDVRPVNAEQLSPNTFPPTAINSQSQIAAGNQPLNFGSPDGAPLVIAPFASSPELERLITQTTVEAAAVTPGESDASRQLFLRKQVQLRLLHLIAGQTDRALQPIPGVDSTDQEFWQQMMWGMANYFDTQGMPDSAERATQTIAQLRAAATRLQEKARLELHNVAFCSKISGFGNYQRFKRDEFMAGQQVLLYAEVADFKSEPTPDGQFRTLMKSTLEVLEGGPTGRLVESLPLAPSEDRCRNQRRDYYYSYEFVIPQSCNPGPHALRLRVEDQLGKKTAVTTLNFTVQ